MLTNEKQYDIITEPLEKQRKVEKDLENWTTFKQNSLRRLKLIYLRKCTFTDASDFVLKRTDSDFLLGLNGSEMSSLDTIYKEFDPGSGRTLAARLTHASRTEKATACWSFLSGGWVSNTWATCLSERNNVWKRTLIPHNIREWHHFWIKDLSLRDGLASD